MFSYILLLSAKIQTGKASIHHFEVETLFKLTFTSSLYPTHVKSFDQLPSLTLLDIASKFIRILYPRMSQNDNMIENEKKKLYRLEE